MPLLTQQGNGHVFIQQTTPTGASTGDLWSDTSSSPPPLKKYNGTSWDSVESHFFIQETTPTGASTGYLWSDISSSPPPLKKYNGTSWDSVETPVWKLVSLG